VLVASEQEQFELLFKSLERFTRNGSFIEALDFHLPQLAVTKNLIFLYKKRNIQLSNNFFITINILQKIYH